MNEKQEKKMQVRVRFDGTEDCAQRWVERHMNGMAIESVVQNQDDLLVTVKAQNSFGSALDRMVKTIKEKKENYTLYILYFVVMSLLLLLLGLTGAAVILRKERGGDKGGGGDDGDDGVDL